MATIDYSGYGNEVLAPLAYAGDQEAENELVRRGNVVVAAREVIQKTVVWGPGNGSQCKVGDVVVIENGKIVSINGVQQS